MEVKESLEGIKSGGKAKKNTDVLSQKENSRNFPHLSLFVKELCSKNVYEYIGKLIGKDLSNCFVRLEVICDRQGFWLKPHCDIKKNFYLHLYL